MAKPSVDKLRAAFRYDPDTGVFSRIDDKSRARYGVVAGTIVSGGRVALSLAKVRFYAHQAAWAYVHGYWPDRCVDHINGDTTDNRIANLRLATHAQNMQNRRSARSDSRSGLIGAMPHQGKWRSDIRINGRKFFLGTFDTAEEANAAYIAAKRAFHPFCTI